MTQDILRKVRKIEIKTRRLSANIFAGQYHSAFKGRGMAFSEVREYQFGDDVRDIDWNVTARFNRPYVKVFEEERELTVMLMIDVSGSLDFGTRVQMKRSMVTEIAATIAFSAIQNNDKIGVVFFSDRIEKYIPPKKGRKHILYILVWTAATRQPVRPSIRAAATEARYFPSVMTAVPMAAPPLHIVEKIIPKSPANCKPGHRKSAGHSPALAICRILWYTGDGPARAGAAHIELDRRLVT